MNLNASLESDSTHSLIDDDLSRAFSLLKIIRDHHRRRFPFLRDRLDYELLLFIGHCQVLGTPMNLTEILTSNFSSVSTVVRHLGRLEKLKVIYKRRAANDKRNVYYFLADEHIETMRELIDYLQRKGASDMAIAQPSIQRTHN